MYEIKYIGEINLKLPHDLALLIQIVVASIVSSEAEAWQLVEMLHHYYVKIFLQQFQPIVSVIYLIQTVRFLHQHLAFLLLHYDIGAIIECFGDNETWKLYQSYQQLH